MEKNLSFSAESVSEIVGRLVWAQLELFGDDVQQVQVMVAGDEQSVEELRVEERDGKLYVEQPQFTFSLNFLTHKWMQVCIRIPREWRGGIDAHTVSGLLNSRSIKGTDITLDTISGDLRAMAVGAKNVALRTVSGNIKGGDLRGEMLSVRTVSGDGKLQSIAFEQVRLNAVSGNHWLEFRAPFARVEATTVSGDVELHVPMDTLDASIKAVSGRLRTAGITLKEGGSIVRLNGVSSDLEIISTLHGTEKQ